MPFYHPHVHQQIIHWTNKHATYERPEVTRLLPVAAAAGGLARWRRVGEVLKAIVQYAFDNAEPLRPDGSRWSLSNIGMPTKLALSLAAHDVAEQLPQTWVSPAYQHQLTQSRLTPMLVSGAMKLSRLNRILAIQDLAMQTSGASDGQTLAGACATGTHGSAIRVGAIHDTIRAVHLMIAPQQAVFIQPESAPLTPTVAADLTEWLNLPTQMVNSDELFHAVLVHLGSLGLVLNMVLEAAPLYYLTRIREPYTNSDNAWKAALQRPSAEGLSAYHYDVVLNPYVPLPKGEPRAWVTSMETARFSDQPDVEIRPSVPDAPNPDVMGILARFLELVDLRLTNPTFRKHITKELVGLYDKTRTVQKALPGVMFGPTRSPERRGDSIEFALDAQHALSGVEAILEGLRRQLRQGQQFAGVVGIRFAPRSAALLASNLADMTCFIELPAIRTAELEPIFTACGQALEAAGIGFGCHWGETHLNTPERVELWWGLRAQQWRSARRQLLDNATARTVFASPILADTGLD